MEQNLVCDNCGGTLAVDASGEIGTCIYCGTKKQLVEKVVNIIEHTGKVEVDGIATAAAKLTSAYQCLQTGNVEKANRLYKEITELEPQNPYAWWGRFLCEESFAQYYGFKDKYGKWSNAFYICDKQIENKIVFTNTRIDYPILSVGISNSELISKLQQNSMPAPKPQKSKTGLIIGVSILVIIFIIIKCI